MTCLINIFYDMSNKDMRIHFCYAIPSEIKSLYREFEQDVLQEQRACCDLLNAHGLKIAYTLAPEWELLSFQPDEYAEIFLKDIFVEVFANFFLLGAVTKPFQWDFTADEEAFHITAIHDMAEPLRKTADIYVGMRSINRMLAVLWGDESATPQEHIELFEEANTFHIRLHLPHILAQDAGKEELIHE